MECTDCRRVVNVVVDARSGDTICPECGLVLDAFLVEEQAEYRTFADDSDSRDPTRVGGPINPLLSGGGLSTSISKGSGSGAAAANFATLERCHNRMAESNSDKALLASFRKIENMSEILQLVPTISNRANEIYKKVAEEKSLRGRSQDAVAAACLYIACRQEDKPRTFKELLTAANGASKKDIGRAATFIVKLLEDGAQKPTALGSIHASDFLTRFCSHLCMSRQAVKATVETVKKVQEMDVRRSPISIAAAVIYIISMLSEKKPLKDISAATGVAESTIKATYTHLRPHAPRLVPSWFCSPELVKQQLPH